MVTWYFAQNYRWQLQERLLELVAVAAVHHALGVNIDPAHLSQPGGLTFGLALRRLAHEPDDGA